MRRIILLLAIMVFSVHGAHAADLSHFEEVTTTTLGVPALGLEFEAPYKWGPQPPRLPGQIANFHDGNLIPSLGVSTPKRVEGLPLEASAMAVAQSFGSSVQILSEGPVDLGGVPARQAIFNWHLPVGFGVDLRTLVLSVYQGDQWIVVSVTDGQIGSDFREELSAVAQSVRFKERSDQ